MPLPLLCDLSELQDSSGPQIPLLGHKADQGAVGVATSSPTYQPQRMRTPICSQKKAGRGRCDIFGNLELWGPKRLPWGQSQGYVWNTHGQEEAGSIFSCPLLQPKAH